ncbi:MAG TPA: DPP IV N-terminal domain-containing protein [Bryobacteraceae bacterium]|nr:DPP IV N-terminal domain-containing protein [Bryobacteraceae bacterium]
MNRWMGAMLCAAVAPGLWGQGTLADYERAHGLQAKARGLVVDAPGAVTWIGSSEHFWYSRSVKGGTEFMLVDAGAGTKKPAFDHEKLAAAIATATGHAYTAHTLPFAPSPGGRGGRGAAGVPTSAPLRFADDEQSIQFGAQGSMYKCTLSDYKCSKTGAIPANAFGRGARGGGPEDDTAVSPEGPGGDPADGLEYQPPAPQQGDGGRAGSTSLGCAPRSPSASQGQGRGGRGGRLGVGSQFPSADAPDVCASFDGKWEAHIENYNVFLKQAGSKEPGFPLSFDGSEGNYYTLRSVAWSPDSTKLVAYHTRPGYDREVHYIESSPTDQVQPKHITIHYLKPGDTLDIAYPALFDVATKKEVEIDRELFPNPYDITPPVWWKDSRGFTFEYNQRGHQVYRVIEVDAKTGQARPLITETSKTFIYYNQLGPGLSGGRRYRHNVNDGKEIIWASERDGWEHLYLYDGVTGQVKNQITKGDWLVRNVAYVDDEKRQIWFEAGGMIAGQDPYFVQYCRINFDGTGLTKLTDADGTHTVEFSHDRKFYVDTWQRVDLPPVAQLRRTEDQKILMELDKGDATALLAAGFHYPEVFVAKGRDGKTDIWGIIIRPTNFDPHKKYPVIENIYAGPQGSFVPKTFSAVSADQSLAELGFIVVHIDGMGTSNRSKAFHDVAFQKLGDAGFPDRILWHKAVAAKYPWYDITRAGIFGTSAGGQNSLGGVLFHPEFYKVVVTNSGCHDNRMDKMWWNEQWMGWPIGPQYAASSNVDNAYRLQGKALIIVGEMDSNVDPASSLQVVNALVKAHKHFDMLYIPGQNHGVGILASEHYRDDYFVHNLLGVEPPDWNKVSLPAEPADTGNGN